MYTRTLQWVIMCNPELLPSVEEPNWHPADRREGGWLEVSRIILRNSLYALREDLAHRYGRNQLMKKLQDLQLSLLSSHAKILPKKKREKNLSN